MLPLARALLPLVAVAALLITLVVPMMVPSDPDSSFFRYTSFGDGSEEPAVVMLVIWALVLTAAGLAWIPRWPALWSVAAFLAALPLIALPLWILLDPPMLIWDGIDVTTGRPTGGMIEGRPAFGSVLWALGSVALTASGACGVIEALRSILRRRRAARAAG